MKKLVASFVLCFMLGVLGLAMGGLVSKPFTFAPTTLIKSAEVNSNLDTIYNEFNGNISDANISASAAIQQSKISTLVSDLASKLNDTGDTITGELKSKYATPCRRWTGTEASAKDWQMCESAGALILQENTGTEGAPTWTTRYTLPAGAGGPATGTDLTTKTYVDGLTKNLAFVITNKTDTDFNTTSTTFVNVSGLSGISFTPTVASRARITFVGGLFITGGFGGGRGAFLNVKIDGADVLAPNGLFQAFGNAGEGVNPSFSIVTDTLSAAAHTIDLQLKINIADANAQIKAGGGWVARLTIEQLPY